MVERKDEMEALLAALSLSKKAGRLVWGFDEVKSSVKKGTAKLILLSEELSPKTKKEVRFFAQADTLLIKEIPLKINEIWYVIGKKAGILAVTEAGLAGKLLHALEQIER